MSLTTLERANGTGAPYPILQAALDAMRPDPDLTVSEWADRYRILAPEGSSEPGRWRTDRTPYLREIMDSLSASDPTEVVGVRKGAQVGMTEAGNNWVGYVIDHAPAPMLAVLPTLQLAKQNSKQRIGPMIRGCPSLAGKIPPARARDSGNTILIKEFPGGVLVMGGANSSVGLRSMPVRDLFLDEVDAYAQDVDDEGDPVKLAERRTATYGGRRKVFIPSTPTIKGISKADAVFERGDQRYYHVPCPKCGDFAPITWKRIRWPKGHPERVYLACDSCGAHIPEAKKTEMLARGKWVPTAKGEPGYRTYQISALYSPYGWFSWEKAVREFLSAKRAGYEEMKVWVNTVLGESWEEGGITVNEDTLLARRAPYPEGVDVPEGALVLTAGVDLQTDRIEVEVVGWGSEEQSWSIDYQVLEGDPHEDFVWSQLDDLLMSRFVHESGHHLRISSACIDSGHATQRVYDFVRRRQARGVWAVKGRSGPGHPVVSAPTKRRTGRDIRPVRLFMLGVDQIKGIVYSHLRRVDPGPGYCHFPNGPYYDTEYFAQLTAEKKVRRYHKGFPRDEWKVVRPGGRNEALDCRVYALAALYILNPALPVIAKRLSQKPGEARRAARPKSPRPVRRATGWTRKQRK